jgi:hypothetical protein
MYEGSIQEERKKLAKRKSKRTAIAPSKSDDSDTDVSLNVIETDNAKKQAHPTCAEKPKTKNRKKTAVKVTSPQKTILKKKKKKSTEEQTDEEQAYQQLKVDWLNDHGPEDEDEQPEDENATDTSTST